MTGNPKDVRDALRRLADSLAEDILQAPDQEILEGAKEIYGSPDKLAADMLKLFEQTASEQGKARLAAARAAVAADRRRGSNPVRMDAAEARRRFQRIIEADRDAMRTLAARKGDEPSDDDVRSAVEDFEELGGPPLDSKDSNK
jgi:hypothetical protein